jgi:hypothetical protein
MTSRFSGPTRRVALTARGLRIVRLQPSYNSGSIYQQVAGDKSEMRGQLRR